MSLEAGERDATERGIAEVASDLRLSLQLAMLRSYLRQEVERRMLHGRTWTMRVAGAPHVYSDRIEGT